MVRFKCISYFFMLTFCSLLGQDSTGLLMDSLWDAKEAHFKSVDEKNPGGDFKRGILGKYCVDGIFQPSKTVLRYPNDEENYIPGIVGFCRAHMVLKSSSLKTFDSIDISKINPEIAEALANSQDDCKISSRCGIASDDQSFIKVRLLAFSLPWNEYLRVFKSLVSDTDIAAFHDFSNEEALFILYSHPIISWFDWYFVDNKDKMFYISCLAGALKKLIKNKYNVEVNFREGKGEKANIAIVRTYLEQVGGIVSRDKKER